MEKEKLKMENTGNTRIRYLVRFILTVASIIVAASVLSLVRMRLDLTEDKRYTLSQPAMKVLRGIDEDIYIQVFLDGDMPIPLKRLKRSVREMLDEFRLASRWRIDYEFINPAESKDAKQREVQYTYLYNKGLNPIDVYAGDDEGGSMKKRIFPGMIINYNGIEVPVNFLKNNQSVSSEQNILHSIESLEYEMIQNIATISSDTIYKVAFLEGQGELPEIEVADITFNLAKFFTVDRGSIGGQPGILDNYAAVVVAAPMKEFTEPDKLILDQYIMNGGKVLWLYEEVDVNVDSMILGETVGLYHTLNIEDLLFRYGVRINPEIVQDIECMWIPISVSTGAEQKQIVQAPWIYYPLLTPNQKHPITRNLNKVKGEFVNTIDTVGLDPNIKKTILLTSSAYSKTISPPVVISLRDADKPPDESQFNKSSLPVSVLLEGVFPSAFRNRMIGNILTEGSFNPKYLSQPTKMIVIADGDIIRNEVRRSATEETPIPLGQDRYSGQMFGNRDFLINCLNFLVDDNGLMELRSRELKMRLLNKQRVKDEKLMWQFINIGRPMVILILAGLAISLIRKIKYTSN